MCLILRLHQVCPSGTWSDKQLIKIVATGTAEVGGWSTRELLTILDGLVGLEVVGADVGMSKIFCYHRAVAITDVLL
jgi:hypothetical protein